MKEYPTISREKRYGLPVYIFDKLDGSNIRAEWVKNKGFTKFGTRHQLLDKTNLILGKSISLIKNKYENDLTNIFIKQRYQSVLCFFEFLGPNSFAGNHVEQDNHDIFLIDVAPYKQGYLQPDEFVDLFDNVETAKLLYYGNFNKIIEQQIEDGVFENMTFEGVVCKAKRTKKHTPPVMFKVKNKQWIQKLKVFCKGDEELFEKLL